MKPLFILLTVLSSFFAQAKNEPSEVAPAAIRSFERTFSQAREVYWTISDNLYKVNFQVSGQYATAYYTGFGELVATTRNISPLQLPVVLLAAIKKDYTQQWISELVEVSDEQGTHYYVTLEDAGQKLTLKSNSTVSWSRFQKMDK